MEEFNSNDYQGRNKNRVKNNYKVAYYATMIFFSIIGALYIYSLIIKLL